MTINFHKIMKFWYSWISTNNGSRSYPRQETKSITSSLVNFLNSSLVPKCKNLAKSLWNYELWLSKNSLCSYSNKENKSQRWTLSNNCLNLKYQINNQFSTNWSISVKPFSPQILKIKFNKTFRKFIFKVTHRNYSKSLNNKIQN